MIIICRTCNTPKEHIEYYKAKLNRTGYMKECISCFSQRCKNNEKKYLSRRRELSRKRYRENDVWRAKRQRELREWKKSERGKRLTIESGKAWRKANPDKVRTNDLRKSYGITLEDKKNLLEAQGNKCAICPTILSIDDRQCCIDHCHATDKIRGVLCSSCNFMLGNAKDNPDTLIAAANYLINSR